MPYKSHYPEVNEMVLKLLRVCPDFDAEKSAAKDPSVQQLMYDLCHFVMAKVKADESDSLAPLCATLETLLEEDDLHVRSELHKFMGCINARGKIEQLSPDPFVSQLGPRGREFYQKAVDFSNMLGPMIYGDVY